MSSRPLVLTLTATTVFLGGFVSSTLAQTDHLHCYKVKDETKFSEAVVDLDPLVNPPFGLATGCRLKGKVKKLCSPTAKTVTSTDATQLEISGPAIDTEYTCYKIKCDSSEVATRNVSDQFGAHTVTKFKSQELCVPVGSPTTTSTSTTMPPTTDCTVTFSLSDAVALTALQFQVDYSGAPGEFIGSSGAVSCSSSLGGVLHAANDIDASDSLRFSAAGVSDSILGPTEVLSCGFSSVGGPVAPGMFSVTEVDAIAVADMPVGGGNLCAAPITGNSPPFARDAARILGAAVGQPLACDVCECDTNNSGKITASDSLAAIRASTELPQALTCPSCSGGPVVSGPSEAVTVTVGVTCP